MKMLFRMLISFLHTYKLYLYLITQLHFFGNKKPGSKARLLIRLKAQLYFIALTRLFKREILRAPVFL